MKGTHHKSTIGFLHVISFVYQTISTGPSYGEDLTLMHISIRNVGQYISTINIIS